MDRRLGGIKALTSSDDAILYQHCRMFEETEQLAVLRDKTVGSVELLEGNLSSLVGPNLVAAFQELGKLRKLIASFATQIRQGRLAQRVLLLEFCLTPASRPRLRLPGTVTPDDKSDDKNTLQRFINRRRAG